jgi:hypothetical protein
MRRDLEVAIPLLAVVTSACAHLVQPQTWTPDARTLEIQQSEYLAKELVRGLPEAVFVRWYAPESARRDPLRPAIRTRGTEGAFTVYEVASDAGVAGRVAFRDAALDHWSRMRLVQESVFSSWVEEEVTPRQVPDAALVRIAALDPVAEPLHPGTRPDPDDVCRLETGTTVDTLVPLLFDHDHGNRLIRWFPPSRLEEKGGPVSVLPAGTMLTIEPWDVAHGRRLAGRDGTHYLVDAPLGLKAFADVVCPTGECAPSGALGVVTEELAIWSSVTAGDPSLAVLPGRSRVPVWMERIGTLRAGDTVRVRKWNACAGMSAEIEPAEGSAAGTTATLQVPVAPPGLFRPVAAAGGSEPVRETGAPQSARPRRRAAQSS